MPIKIRYVRRREFIGGIIVDNGINDKNRHDLWLNFCPSYQLLGLWAHVIMNLLYHYCKVEEGYTAKLCIYMEQNS